VVSSWRTAPPVLRKLALWVWGVGLVAAAGSITIDVQGRWTNLPFLTNLLSETISAAIALPIALLVVSQLAAYQVEELARPRREERVHDAREQMVRVVGDLRNCVFGLREEATAATDAFIRAIRPAAFDLPAIKAAARDMHATMDANESALLERFAAPVRIYGTYLHSALVDRNRSGGYTEDIVELERLSSELGLALAHHERVIERGGRLFGERFERERVEQLRDAALEYLRTIDRLMDLAQELALYTGGPELTP
jgi:hypothetical protein